MGDLLDDLNIDELMKKYDELSQEVEGKLKRIEEDYGLKETSEQGGDDSLLEISKPAAGDDFLEVSGDRADDNFLEMPGAADKVDDDFLEVPRDKDNDSNDSVASTVNISREPQTPSIIPGTGLVLAGGGGKGIYQVGMLKVLDAAGLLDDVVAISGVSIGAVNTVLYAMGVEKMERIWDDIDSGVLFDFDPEQIASGNVHFSRNEMNSLIDKYLDFGLISGEKRTLYAGTSKCAANYSDLDPTYGCTARYFKLNDSDEERINQILLASTAMPYIYSPVTIDGERYIDGGINDNVPVKPLYDMGIRRFIVIELSPESKIDRTSFPDAEIIDILPSHDLGLLFTGTLNFEVKDKRVKKELGERDARIYIKSKFERDETYISMERRLLDMEYEAIVRELSHVDRKESLEKSVSSNLDKFNAIAEKYK